jgi:hypothetical protein
MVSKMQTVKIIGTEETKKALAENQEYKEYVEHGTRQYMDSIVKTDKSDPWYTGRVDR